MIGGGPIGCFSALNALKHGIDVKIFEEHTEVGAPEHCTGHVSIKGLKHLELKVPQKIVQQQVYGYRFYSPSGESITFKFKRPQTIIVNRHEFDRWFADKFTGKGGLYYPDTKVTCITPTRAGRWEIKYIQGGSTKKTITNILIDAEGFPPSLLIKAQLHNQDAHYVYAIQSWMNNIQDVEKGVVEIYLTKRFSPSFYGWIAPLSNGTAKVGLGSTFPQVQLMFDRFKKHHPIASNILKTSNTLRLKTHLIPLGGPPKKLSHTGLMAVGDAVSQVKQTSGGGLITGLSSAKIAGKTAAYAVKNADPKAVARYESAFRRQYGINFTLMKILRNGMDRLSDKHLDKIIKRVSCQAKEISIESDVDFDNQLNLLYDSLINPSLFKVLFLIISGV